MNPWLKRLPGFQRSASGLEWTLWRRLPAIFVWGTLTPVALALVWHLLHMGRSTPAAERSLLLFDYIVAGVLVLHWTLVLTLAIGCVIVMVMKGPAYVADRYDMPDSDRPT